MVKILILYSSLGSGHLSAARALEEAFCRFPEVKILIEDALEFAGPVYRAMVQDTYKQLSERAPYLYQLIYEESDQDDLEETLKGNRFTARMEGIFFTKLEEWILQESPDILISVQQIPSRFLDVVSAKGRLAQPHYVVLTDLIAHSSWINENVDGYFVPSGLSAEMLSRKGVDSSLISVTGIPIRLEVSQPKEIMDTRKRLQLPVQGPIVTLLGGGLQPKRVRRMIQSLQRWLPEGVLMVVAGRNGELTKAIQGLETVGKLEIRKLGMIDYMDDVVVASDLIVSKTGGLITSEIMARGTPMLIVDPIPGQEQWNADGVAAAGAGLPIGLPEMVGPAAHALLNDRERITQMHNRALRVGRPQAAQLVAEKVMENWRRAGARG